MHINLAQWLRLAPSLEPAVLKPGVEGQLIVAVTIPAGGHIESDQPAEKFLIPTKLVLDPIEHIGYGPIRYPKAIEKRFSWTETVLKVFSSTIQIKVPLIVSRDAPAKTVTIFGTLNYQGCTASSCLPPNNQKFSIEAKILP